MTCYDLTTSNKAPPAVIQLLGLGAGFYFQPKHIKESNVSKGLARFYEDIRIKTLVKCMRGAKPDKECPNLCMKNPD